MHCKYFTRLFKWTLLAEWEIAILCKCWEKGKRLPNGWKAQCGWAHSFVDIWWNFISVSSSYFMKHVAIRNISRDHWHLMQIWVFQPPTQASIAYFFQSEKIYFSSATHGRTVKTRPARAQMNVRVTRCFLLLHPPATSGSARNVGRKVTTRKTKIFVKTEGWRKSEVEPEALAAMI